MNKALFLDRDGTVLVEMGYLTHPSLVVPYEFAFEALRLAKDNGFLLIVITNQSGIARGWLSEADLHTIHRRMQRLFQAERISIDAIYFCPHHPEGTVSRFRMKCACRKPGTVLGQLARSRFGIDFKRSFVVGDKKTDVLFGKSLGVTPCLVRTGYGAGEEKLMGLKGFTDFHVFDNLLDGVNWIISQEMRD